MGCLRTSLRFILESDVLNYWTQAGLGGAMWSTCTGTQQASRFLLDLSIGTWRGDTLGSAQDVTGLSKAASNAERRAQNDTLLCR